MQIPGSFGPPQADLSTSSEAPVPSAVHKYDVEVRVAILVWRSEQPRRAGHACVPSLGWREGSETLMADRREEVDLESQASDTSPLLMDQQASVRQEHVVTIGPDTDSASVENGTLFRSSSSPSVPQEAASTGMRFRSVSLRFCATG